MTKSQKRALRHKQRQAAQNCAWNVETSASGGFEIVRERTSREERQHERAMDRWARNGGGGDFDYSMNY